MVAHCFLVRRLILLDLLESLECLGEDVLKFLALGIVYDNFLHDPFEPFTVLTLLLLQSLDCLNQFEILARSSVRDLRLGLTLPGKRLRCWLRLLQRSVDLVGFKGNFRAFIL